MAVSPSEVSAAYSVTASVLYGVQEGVEGERGPSDEDATRKRRGSDDGGRKLSSRWEGVGWL